MLTLGDSLSLASLDLKILPLRVVELARDCYRSRLAAEEASLKRELASAQEKFAAQGVQGGPCFWELIEIGKRSVNLRAKGVTEELKRSAVSHGVPYSKGVAKELNQAFAVIFGFDWQNVRSTVVDHAKVHANPDMAFQQTDASLQQTADAARREAETELAHFVVKLESEGRRQRQSVWTAILSGGLAGGIVSAIAQIAVRMFHLGP